MKRMVSIPTKPTPLIPANSAFINFFKKEKKKDRYLIINLI
jgi:hypothetical protein